MHNSGSSMFRIFLFDCAIVLLLFCISGSWFSVHAQQPQTTRFIWLEQAGTEGTHDPVASQITVNRGDTVDIEIWVEMRDFPAQGISFYLSYDDPVLAVVNSGSDDAGFKPFDFSESIFDTLGAQVVLDSVYFDDGNFIPGMQIDGSIVLGTGSISGKGLVATFRAVALIAAENSQITIDDDQSSHRDTRLHNLDQGAQSFEPKRRLPMSITIVDGTTDIESLGSVKTVSGYALAQNYPNPFNPGTTIRYTIPVRTRVLLQIYNVGGRLIRILNNTIENAGEHSVIWNGTTHAGLPVASGVYFYRLQVGDNVFARQMVLLK